MDEEAAARDAQDNLAEGAKAMDLISVSRLVKVAVKIRDAKAAFKKEADAKLEDFERQYRTITTELTARAQAEGVDGFKTEFGTVYMAVDMKTSCQDWGVFYDWIKKEDALDFLERRISSGKVKDYMEAHEGELPPGVSVFKQLEARIRRPSGT
jgi:hypothetical protein